MSIRLNDQRKQNILHACSKSIESEMTIHFSQENLFLYVQIFRIGKADSLFCSLKLSAATHWYSVCLAILCVSRLICKLFLPSFVISCFKVLMLKFCVLEVLTLFQICFATATSGKRAISPSGTLYEVFRLFASSFQLCVRFVYAVHSLSAVFWISFWIKIKRLEWLVNWYRAVIASLLEF